MTELQSTAETIPAGGRVRWLRIGVGIVLAMLLAASAMLIWLVNDAERVRHAIEMVVSAISDRPLRIEGKFDYELGRITNFQAEKIRWGPSESDSSFHMLEIDAFTGSIDLFSLLSGPIVITEAYANNAVLRFELNHDGIAPRKLESPGSLPLIIKKSRIQNVSVRLRHHALTEELELILQEIQQRQDQAGRMVVSSRALLEGRQLVIDGHMGPFQNLSVGEAVDFGVKVKGPLATFTAEGNFNWSGQTQGVDIKAGLTAPSAVDLAHRLKIPLDTDGSVQMDADLSIKGDAMVAAVKGSFGEYAVDTRFRSDDLHSLQGLDVFVRSSGPSIRDLAAIAGLDDLPHAPYELDVRAKPTEHGIDLQRFRLETTGLNVNGSGRIKTESGIRDINLEATAAGTDFASVAQLYGLDVKTQLPFNLKVTVVGNGQGIRDVVDAELQLGHTTASVTGLISEAVDFSGSQFKFTVIAPDANDLGRIAGIQMPVGAKLKAHGSSSIRKDWISFKNIQMELDGSVLTGSARLDRNHPKRGFEFNGEMKGPNLARMMQPLFPDSARPLMPQLPFTASATLRLASGILDIESVSANVGKSMLGFSGRVDLNRPDNNLTGDLSISGYSIAEILSGVGIEQVPDTVFDLKTKLHMSPGTIHLSRLSYKGKHGSIYGLLSLTGKGYSTVEFDLTGRGGKLSDLVPDMAAYHPADVPFKITAKGTSDLEAIMVDRFNVHVGDARLELSGEIQVQPTLVARGVRLNGSGPRLSDLGTLGKWRLKDRPFKMNASIQSSAKNTVVEGLRFGSGRNNLNGRIQYIPGRKVPTVKAVLKSTYLNLDEIRTTHPDKSRKVAKAPSKGRMFSNNPLPFALLDALNGELSLKIKDLILDQRRWRNLVAEATLKNRVLKVRRAHVDAAEGKLSVRGSVKPARNGRNVELDITATNAMVVFHKMTAKEIKQLPRHAVSARLSARGNTPHQLAASLDGFIWVVGGRGQMRRSLLGPLGGDFLTELLTAINPLSRKKQLAQIDCQGIYFEITKGKFRTAPAIVLQTEDVVAVARGTINMATEKVDFTFETTQRKGIGISLDSYTNHLTKISGTLSRPKIILNPTGVLLKGGAAVATGGMSVLVKGLFKRLTGTNRLCERMADEAVKIRSKRGAVPNLGQLMAGTRKPGEKRPQKSGKKGKTGSQGSLMDEQERW